MRNVKVGLEAKGCRLDVFLTQVLSLSRASVKKMIDEGFIRCGAEPLKRASMKLKGGESFSVRFPEKKEPSLLPESIPLDILYEDDSLLVINKPAGFVVHPGAGHEAQTLVNALLFHCRDLPVGSDPLKPGIVHRLDKGTSGVMVVAKTTEAMESLQHAFKDRQIRKIYLTLLHGKVTPSGTIESKLGRHVRKRQKISSKTKKGKLAVTHWKVLRYFDEKYSWVEVRIETGRTHQIRVHFSEAGHPVVGDVTYGRKKDRFPRPALHASELTFRHPKTGQEICFTAPLPQDIADLLYACETGNI